MSTTLALNKTKANYNRSSRCWTVAGLEFPAGLAGKRGAELAALALERPDIAAEVRSTIANRPRESVSRIIKAGQIVANDDILFLHLNHFEVQSQSQPNLSYIVAKFPQGWRCQCTDWENGNCFYTFGWERSFYPPDIPGIGPACKDIEACLLWLLFNPIEPCSVCNGRCFNDFEIEATGRQVCVPCVPCEGCAGTGAQKVGYGDPDLDIAPPQEEAPQPLYCEVGEIVDQITEAIYF